MPLSWLLNALPAVPFRNALLTALCYLLMLPWCAANDIRIANVVLINQNLPGGFSNVQFDLSWKNSWRYDFNSGINNWDAAWVFVKFKAGATNPTFTGITLTNGSAFVNLPSTAGLRVGMPVRVIAGSSTLPAGTVIASINSATQITLSANSTTTASNNQLEFQRIWEHARLHNTGQEPGTGFTAEPGLLTPGAAWDASSNPALGFVIHREAAGYGDVDLISAQLRWNYADNGLANTALVEVQVFAIEMVYVPQGTFTAGSGGSELNRFTLTTINTATANTVPDGTGSLGGAAGGYPSGQSAPNAAWPNGFPAFYSMKYELSQGQYRDFLNSLTRSQQNSRTGTALAPGTTAVTNRYIMSNFSTVANRNSIRCDASIPAQDPISFYCDLNTNGTGNEAADGEWIGCNFTNWSDHAAYMEWAALRPMTELEFEKAGRGFLPPVANEYAWGTTTIAAAAYTLADAGSTTENISTNYNTASNTGNANYSTTRGTTASPFRVGIFAANAANRDRLTSGSSFWGIMELSGNLWERTVTIANTQGQNFTGSHGMGMLSPNGFATNSAWPGWTLGEVTTATGAGAKAGDHSSAATSSRISDRFAVSNGLNTRALGEGSRGVRTAGCTFSASAPTFDTANGLSPNVAAMGSTLVYKVNETGNFIWIVPAGWEIVSGQGTNQIELQINALPGTIRVGEVNECGASSLTTLIIN